MVLIYALWNLKDGGCSPQGGAAAQAQESRAEPAFQHPHQPGQLLMGAWHLILELCHGFLQGFCSIAVEVVKAHADALVFGLIATAGG